MSKSKKPTPIERFLSLSDAEKDAEVAQFEREIPLSESRPLNAAERKQWRRVKRRLGRPKVGQGAKMVAVSIERGLLQRADRYAKRHAMKRAELIAAGLKLVLAKAS
jgi:hypothetical protein